MSGTVVELKFNRLPELIRRIESGAGDVVAKAALDIEADAKQFAPVDTGALRNSIKAEQLAALSWIVAVGVEYGVYQEFGTRHMAPQPYLVPAFNITAPVLTEALRRLCS